MKNTGKVPKATICYLTQEDIEEEGEDEKICILQLLTYYITGDMIFPLTCEMPFSLVKFCFREHDMYEFGLHICISLQYCEQPTYLA